LKVDQRSLSTISDKGTRTVRLASVCGIIAPVFFTVMIIIESLLRPGYSQISNFISDLGVGTYSILQNINFWTFGILVFVFALGFGRNFLHSRAATIGLSLVAWMVFLAGIFPDEPTPYPGYVHGAVSMIAFLSLVITEFLVWWRLRRLKENTQFASWRKYAYYSLATGIVGIALIITGNPPGYAGLFQRFFLGSGWLWIEIIALKLFRASYRLPTALRLYSSKP
jgi:hypothetical membrane protein